MGWLQVLANEKETVQQVEPTNQVLVVDDNVDITQTIQEYLSHFNYKVFTANSAEKGLQIYKEKKPKILIIDLKMPGLSGLDMLKQIRQHDQETEIIILTAFRDIHDIIDALRHRASDFIIKPVDLETLKLTIEKSKKKLELTEQVKNYTQKLEKLLNDVRNTKEYLQNILINSPQAIVTYDLDGKILEWNAAAEQITGYRAEEVKGKTLKEVLVLSDLLINPLKDGDDGTNQDVVGQIMTKNGDLRYINRRARVLSDAQQNTIGIIENFYDITDQVFSNQLLEKRYLQLQTINEIGKKIASCNDLAEISQFVSDKIVTSFFESSQITIFFYKPELDCLVLEAMSGYNIQKIKNRFPEGARFKIDHGIIGRVFQTGEVFIAEDVSTVPYFDPSLSEETRSEFTFPIKFKDRVYGILNIENIENISLDEADRFMIEAVAEYLGIAKERIALMDQIKMQNVKLEQQAQRIRRTLKKVEKQKKIIEQQHKKLITDLQKASEFQKSLLPETLPKMEDVYLSSYYLPSSQLGGDFYDVINIEDRFLVLIIADASGHGVAAAMLSAMFKMILHKHLTEILNPATVLKKMNADFCSVLQTGEFFSAFIAILDREKNLLKFANAGHPRPLFFDYSTNTVKELDSNGFLLGILAEGVQFEQKEIPLNGKFRLLMFTDGLHEAVNSKDEQFGVERLKTLVIENAQNNAENFIENIKKNLYNYTGSKEFVDDVTLIVMDKISETDNALTKSRLAKNL